MKNIRKYFILEIITGGLIGFFFLHPVSMYLNGGYEALLYCFKDNMHHLTHSAMAWYFTLIGILLASVTATSRLAIQRKNIALEKQKREIECKNEMLLKLKTAILQNISHEVRTPLNAIVGFSQLMAAPNQSPDDLKKYSKVIEAGSDRLTRTMNDIIEICHIQSKQIVVTNSSFRLVELLENIVSNFKGTAEKKNIQLDIKYDLKLKDISIQSDIEKFKKIILHLIDNSLKFTNKGAININCSILDSYLHISVSDTGIGIPANMLQSIFEPFVQVETGTTRIFEGNGLGLPIVKAYVELLNGSVSIKSELNTGTNVEILLPINEKRT